MKEQEHENVTDQGWAAMQRILDQEMPRRRKRLAGWWWLTGLLLLPMLGITGWHWYQQSKQISVPEQSAPLNTAPIASQGLPATTPNQPANPQTAGPETTTQVQANGVSSVSSAPLTGNRTTTSSTSGNFRSTAHLDLTRGSIGSVDDQPIRQKPASQANTTAILTATPALNNIETTQQPLMSEALATLPTPFQTLESGTPEVNMPDYPAAAQGEVKKVSHPLHITLGLTFGANSERIPRINGGLIGFTADWQTFRHWGLRSGVQYAMQRLASDESLVTVITEDAYEKSSSLALFDQSGNYGNISSFSSINTSILASVRRIHRIEAPLLAYWQPVSAFRVYAGAVLNYTFLAQTSNRIFADNQVFKVVNGRDEINRLATDRLQRWQVKWQAGLGYRIGHKAELNASIQTTFPKISFKKSTEMQTGLNTAEQQNHPLVQVRQLGVTLSGVVFF